MTKQAAQKEKRLHGVIWDGLRLQAKTVGIAFLAIWLTAWLYARFYTGPADGTILAARIYTVASDVEVTLTLLVIVSAIYLLTSFAFSFSYTSELKKAITYLIYQLKQVQRGSLDNRIQMDREDEMKRLAGELNDMTDGYEKQIRSMHRVLNENAALIDEKERAAGLEERRKLARDLHDAVSQQLFAVSMSLGAIPRILDTDPDRAKTLITQVETMIHASQQELRALIMHLRPITLEGKGLKEALDALFTELSAKNEAVAFVWETDQLEALDPGIEDQLFRVVQEGLSNTLRHAKASRILFTAEQADQRLLITLSDDGCGFDMEMKKEDANVSYGLTTMEERIEELGGHFSLLSYPAKGTTIKIRVPLRTQKGGEHDEQDPRADR
ncbi:sensor histidine kinase [Alteribacter keqinensis]|uniref:Oxygen sensor histidine kinase NreB n=1 Tax=Alteribacter keqinensis TaxID=2483800 RepID=A0A3M7TXG2_9BACI|nr:sensor histidine kinase [Alteribacter keqinensis]RNA69971.1 sensor histidine kinase [Alteribacter keqinensis]